MSSHVVVIIPNWNGRQHLQTCLSALLRQTRPAGEIVLVDNGSTDGSCAFVAENFPQIRILSCTENLGFAAATNLGIRSTQSDYVATLNNDTEAEPTWLEELTQAMGANPHLGMAASQMLFYHQRGTINSAGIAVDRVGMAWDRLGGLPEGAGTRSQEVFGPCAGAALYRRSMLDQIGLFDEDYFGYLEDVDLAWRGQAIGWSCLYVPSARVYHVHSATGQEGSPLKNYLLGRNKWWTIFKNYPWPHWLAYAPLILAYDLLANLYNLVLKRDIHALRGRLAALRSFPAACEKRRTVQRLPGYSSRLAYDCLNPIRLPWNVWQRYKHVTKRDTSPKAS
jgi:GT2 family glycosyltransferase